FHAEGGIRGDLVTGVQTCALPISARDGPARPAAPRSARGSTLYGSLVARREGGRRPRRTTGSVGSLRRLPAGHVTEQLGGGVPRSEERRVGREWRCGLSRMHKTKW